MRFDVSHRTVYGYGQPVSLSHHLLRLTPRATPRQTCHRSGLAVTPSPDVSRTSSDYFGNATTYITVQEPHTSLSIQARSVVEVLPREAPEASKTLAWDQVRAALAKDTSRDGLDAIQFAFPSPWTGASDEVEAFARPSFVPGRPVLEAALDLTARIFKGFQYDPTATTVATPVDQVFALKRGVCQDFAHLEIACLRSLGLAARYVSGYLLTRPPEGQEKLIGADASHAWLSVYCPGQGWVDLDPTNNVLPNEEHITLAWGRDYGDVSPVNGAILGGGAHTVHVAVDVTPRAA
ncbi:MAG: transglutaminase family protein [Alphaproteobacteria bacterium]|nr:transglutaminase family protein [Alphaproteobacteria bacterium]